MLPWTTPTYGGGSKNVIEIESHRILQNKMFKIIWKHFFKKKQKKNGGYYSAVLRILTPLPSKPDPIWKIKWNKIKTGKIRRL